MSDEKRKVPAFTERNGYLGTAIVYLRQASDYLDSAASKCDEAEESGLAGECRETEGRVQATIGRIDEARLAADPAAAPHRWVVVPHTGGKVRDTKTGEVTYPLKALDGLSAALERAEAERDAMLEHCVYRPMQTASGSRYAAWIGPREGVQVFPSKAHAITAARKAAGLDEPEGGAA